MKISEDSYTGRKTLQAVSRSVMTKNPDTDEARLLANFAAATLHDAEAINNILQQLETSREFDSIIVNIFHYQ